MSQNHKDLGSPTVQLGVGPRSLILYVFLLFAIQLIPDGVVLLKLIINPYSLLGANVRFVHLVFYLFGVNVRFVHMNCDYSGVIVRFVHDLMLVLP